MLNTSLRWRHAKTSLNGTTLLEALPLVEFLIVTQQVGI